MSDHQYYIFSGTREKDILDENPMFYSQLRQFISSRCGLGDSPIILEGGADGVDSLSRQIAFALGFQVYTIWANWKRHGRAAGPIRNKKMIQIGGPNVKCFAFPLQSGFDNNAGGTMNMVSLCKQNNIITEVYPIDDQTGHCNMSLQ